MGKAKASPDQLGFDFSAPSVPQGEAALAGFERRTNVLVGEMLKARDRFVIAAQVSKLLDEEVSKSMLDAYSSPAREDHKVPFVRLMAIVIVTARYDLLDQHLRECGCGIVTGCEMDTVRLGHLEQERRNIDAQIRELRKTATPMRKGGGS